MSIGMTWKEFWYGDVKLTEYYRKAHELKNKHTNEAAWLQGLYVYEALCDASPLFNASFSSKPVKARPYVKEPYPFTEIENKQREERERKKKEEKMQAEFAAFVENMRKRKTPVEVQSAQVGE